MLAGSAPDHESQLLAAIAHAAHHLPAQGPISVFIHHNSLHAFEHLPFHEAVVAAGQLYETEPYLSELQFRALYAEGRITDRDLSPRLEARWLAAPPQVVAGIAGRELERLALLHDLEAPAPALIRWHVEEGEALRRIRSDVAPGARRRLLAAGESERTSLCKLWRVCVDLAPAALASDGPRLGKGLPWTHRDALLAATEVDANELVHPIMARYAAAFLDDGAAAWPMPGREQGFFQAWADLVATDAAPLPGWLHGLQNEVIRARYRERGAAAVVIDALDDLGVAAPHWQSYLTRLLLHLRGWAGIFHWFESHPKETISESRQVRLIDFLAVRLIYDRRAWSHVAYKHFGYAGSLHGLAARLAAAPLYRTTSETQNLAAAWRLFYLTQLLGLDATDLSRHGATAAAALLAAVEHFTPVERRRIWQEAYEAHYRTQLLDALANNLRHPLETRQPAQPSLQVICCIDEREESLRRHLEEISTDIETFGTAGFFGLAIDYAGLDDGHPAPLCPIVVAPSHAVRELPIDSHQPLARQRNRRRRHLHRLQHGGRHASQGLVRGTLSTPLLGIAAAFAMPAQVFAPRITAGLREAVGGRLLPAPTTRLAATAGPHADDEDPSAFPIDVQVARIASTLENIGLLQRCGRLVCVLGHGSVSANNPHGSAYDCGACGGRHGGANARLFADLANRPAVRAGLRQRGIDVADDTVFIGGLHNTSTDAITLFDLDRVPATHATDLATLQSYLDEARGLSAQERCRRFESAPRHPTPESALRHVETRTTALSEPRPELGHATNAACIVGRRSLTRNLFLDRRSFLVSYDPDTDPSGAILERTLAAVGPVGAGISLEYYFSYVDNAGYGCGNKLPHNVVGLLGVMDGPASDLRTGLPKQMIEVHEPMRLLLIVEAEPQRITAATARQPGIIQLVTHQWIQLVSLSPATHEMRRWTPDGWQIESGAPTTTPTAGSSRSWYAGAAGPLPPALIHAGRLADVA